MVKHIMGKYDKSPSGLLRNGLYLKLRFFTSFNMIFCGRPNPLAAAACFQAARNLGKTAQVPDSGRGGWRAGRRMPGEVPLSGLPHFPFRGVCRVRAA